MLTGIIGRKIGMTQLFAQDGTVVPGTVIKAGPCVVVQTKAVATEGYEAVQLGLVEERPARVRKPLAGHYKKADVPPTRVRREVKVAKGAEAPKTGEQVLVTGVFNNGDRVDVIGISRGKGFQGVMKRHNFRGGAADFFRRGRAAPRRSHRHAPTSTARRCKAPPGGRLRAPAFRLRGTAASSRLSYR